MGLEFPADGGAHDGRRSLEAAAQSHYSNQVPSLEGELLVSAGVVKAVWSLLTRIVIIHALFVVVHVIIFVFVFYGFKFSYCHPFQGASKIVMLKQREKASRHTILILLLFEIVVKVHLLLVHTHIIHAL
jgi:hypothetical protein